MGIPIGKLALYTVFAGMKPHKLLPVVIDVGTNNPKMLENPEYIGLRQKRVRGEVYDELIDEFMKAIVKRYGLVTLIQFEDFANQNAFRLLDKYQHKYCTFNDDIQGTASVVLAGLLSSSTSTGKKISENKFLIFGAGGAGLGIAAYIVKAIVTEGISCEEARGKIWMVDINGLITQSRTDLNDDRKCYAKDHEDMKSLEEIVKDLKPSVLIGVSTVGGAFNKTVLTDMAKFNKRPVIFALSNPTNRAECTAEQAYTITEGRAVFSSGSPFPPTIVKGKKLWSGQGNNAYIFPGVALGVTICGARHVPDQMFIMAAQILAEQVTKEDRKKGRLYPSIKQIKNISILIATKIARYAYKNKLATKFPIPEDPIPWEYFDQFNFEYGNEAMPVRYPWPKSNDELEQQEATGANK